MSNQEQFKILIVDDEKANIAILSHMLTPEYAVLVAKDGESAINVAKTSKPDLILLDIIMPGMSGFETLATLKEHDLTRSIPVIFITGQDSVEDEARGLALGAVDYITRPFHNSIVSARIHTHIRIIRYVRMIEHQCMIDAITNIPNRRFFDNRIGVEWERAIREGLPVSILMIDVDGFKGYNDAFGHTQGDTLLRAVATVLEQAADSLPGFASRWGGDEFAILLPDTDLSEALQIAETIRADVEQMSMPLSADTDAAITVSIGVSTVTPVADSSTEDLISEADRALYAAKNDGRNRALAASDC